MSAQAAVINGTIWEDGGATFLARVLGNSGTAVKQADVSAISYKVFDRTLGNTQTSSGAIIVANAIFDTLQLDARWTSDTTGYNFRYAMAASAFPTGDDHIYRIEFLFTPVSGEKFFVVFEVLAREVYSS